MHSAGLPSARVLLEMPAGQLFEDVVKALLDGNVADAGDQIRRGIEIGQVAAVASALSTAAAAVCLSFPSIFLACNLHNCDMKGLPHLPGRQTETSGFQCAGSVRCCGESCFTGHGRGRQCYSSEFSTVVGKSS